MASSESAPDAELVRSCNWNGAIPCQLTLAPTSLGTTTMPHPIHVMLNRATFLHVGLKDAILRLHKFAPATISFSGMKWTEPGPQDNNSGNDDDGDGDEEKESKETANDKHEQKKKDATKTPQFPVCWLEDEETQIPLRWQIFAGVLFDMLTTTSTQSQTHPSQQVALPWKIRLHFTNYPSFLLPLEQDQVWKTVERSFKNSLKQALFLQYGNSKIAMNMSKQIHQRLWDSVVSSNYKLYQQINADLQVAEKQSAQLIPIRLYLDSKPPLQRPCRYKDDGANSTTLGSLLLNWLPELFYKASNSEQKVEAKSSSYRWFVGGIVPPLSLPLLDLWQNLCHPDHFLYIVVLTR